MFITAGWLENFTANLAADLLVALAVGIILAQYLGIRSERQKRRELRKKALELILSELRTNRDRVQRVERDWSNSGPMISYADMGAWRLASENRLLEGLDVELAGHLLNAYAKLRDLEDRSRLAFQMLFELSMSLRKPIDEIAAVAEMPKAGAELAKRCSQELGKAIQAIENQYPG